MTEIKVAFWNVRRLGAGSPQSKLDAIEANCVSLRQEQPDCIIFCELVGSAIGGVANGFNVTPQNITYRRKNAHQLCYGCLIEGRHEITLKRAPPPEVRSGYRTWAASVKGGTDFTHLTDRAVAALPPRDVDGVTVYVYAFHAPANNRSAARALSFLLYDLIARHGALPAGNNGDLAPHTVLLPAQPPTQPGKWVLIGDLNIEPDELQRRNPDFAGYIQRSKTSTYQPLLPGTNTTRGDREYDYAITNIKNARMSSFNRSTRLTSGDHIPIALTFDLTGSDLTRRVSVKRKLGDAGRDANKRQSLWEDESGPIQNQPPAALG